MKHAFLRIWPQGFIDFCKGGIDNIELVENGLPEDTKFVRAGHDEFGYLFLVLESETFKDLKEGDILPELKMPQFNKVYKK